MDKIRIALVGVGNCASALIQGIHYYKYQSGDASSGLIHWEIGGYRPYDVDVVAAFDIDCRKVGNDVAHAIFCPPNNTKVFHKDVPNHEVSVRMGRVLDGFADHMCDYPAERTFVLADEPEPDIEEVVAVLKATRAQVLVNCLPVGSEQATRFYATCALKAGVSFINNIPVFIASDPVWANRFAERKLVMIGDDIKSQIGATIVHRALTNLFKKRGGKLDRTYQLNTGGNTDFLNMLNRSRLHSKKVSKTEAVQAVTAERLDDENIHIGPSDYVAWQNDNKVCFLRMEGRIFGDAPISIELRLSVEDSPNSAGVAIDAIRCCKLALDRGESGVLVGPSAYFYKHPPQQYDDDEAYRMTEQFIGESAREPFHPLGDDKITAVGE